MNNVYRIILAALVIIGLLCATVILNQRVAHERRDRNVEFVVDYPDLQRIAPVRKGGVTYALARMRAAGATTVAVYEERLTHFEERDQLLVEHGRKWNRLHPDMPLPDNLPLGRGYAVRVMDKKLLPRLDGYLRRFFGDDACFAPGTCIIPYSRRELEEVSMGFTVPETRLAVSLRPFHTPLETPGTIEFKFAAWDKLKNPGPIVFSGNSVTGYPNLLKEMVRQIRSRPGMKVGVLELVEQEGIETITNMAPEQVVQIHSIPDREMIELGREGSVRRMVRAARERRVPVLYLRLFTRYVGKSRQESLEYNLEYVRDVVKGVRAAGFQPGPARAMPAMDVSWYLRAPVICGAVALVLLLAGYVFRVPQGLSVLACLLVFPGCLLAASQGHGTLLLKVSALFIACMIPGLGLSAFFLVPYRSYDGPGRTMPVGTSIVSWLAVCALTAIGGVFIGAILSQRDFLARIDVFTGVKLALIFPFMVILYSYLKVSKITLSDFLNSPFRYLEAAAGLIIIGVLAVYLMRSGNEPSATPLLNYELAARGWLEDHFLIRPRTKEILIGHPALLLLGAIPFARRNYLYLLVLMAGAVGQASLMNSFCHLHTPLGLTGVRVLMGILIGAVLGLALRVLWLAGMKIFKVD